MTISTPIRRLAALMILFFMIMVIYCAAIAPVLHLYARQAGEIETLQDRLRHYRAEAATLSSRRAALATLTRQGTDGDGFLSGPSDILAAARIQNHIKALAQEAHAVLRSTNILPATTENGMQRISLRVGMTVTMQSALDMLYGIESGTPVLFVDNLDLAVSARNRRDRGSDDNDLLDFSFDVYGYRQPASGEKDR